MNHRLPALLLCLFTNVSIACVTNHSAQPKVVDCNCNFSSVEAAVRHAAMQYLECSAQEDREYMGGVLEHAGTFFYSVGRGRRGADKVTVRINIPAGARLVALWHTHGAQHWNRRYFSKIDTDLVERLRLPFYLADPTGNLHVFRPGDPTLTRRQSVRMGLGWESGFARGVPLAQGDDGDVRQRSSSSGVAVTNWQY